MKLEDFSRVAQLRADREYLAIIISAAKNDANRVRIITRTHTNHDLRPSLVAKLMPAIIAAAEEELREVDAELAKLGVTVPGGRDDE